MNAFSVFLCVVAAIASVSATNYCSSTLCKPNYKHIACGHSGKFDSTCPADAKMVTITSDLQKLIVDAHNEKRNFIAGGGDAKHSPACRMATMQWDNELAALAAYNVKQCEIAHDKCHNTDAFTTSGQNLASSSFYDSPDHADLLNNAIQDWFGEVKNSRQSYIDSFPGINSGPKMGHFTVMMADRNIRVGCAAATFAAAGKPYQSYLLACNYATNNMKGFPIYSKCNTAGTSCTTGTNPVYPNLCSASEVYAVNKWF